MNRATRWPPVLIALLLGLASVPAKAHKPSDSYLSLDVQSRELTGRWDIALRDLDFVFDLDANHDGRLRWGEVRRRLRAIDAYALGRLQVTGDGRACTARVTDHLVDAHTDGAYLVLQLAADCSHLPREVDVRYGLLFDVDPTHRGLLKLSVGAATYAAIFAPDSAERNFDAAAPQAWRTLLSYTRDGIGHIWSGYDHLLFLCSLLLPAVVRRRGGRWEPTQGLRTVALDVLRTVTAFTAAHTLTLSLAALGVLQLPSRLVESAIALSVVLAALNNVACVVEERRWLVAFGFGLVHGFGFASVLADLALPGPGRVLALFGFNLGVEIGQVVIVLALLPVIYLLRATAFYRRAVLIGGSCAIALVAAVWLLERSLDLRLFAAS